jgi:atypical dual specificity phosphatase
MPMPLVHPDRRLNQGGPLNAYEDDLPILYSAGIRAVVSLVNLPSDAAVFDSAGFVYLSLPIPDGGAPTMAQMSVFVRFVDEYRQAKRPVVVHCQAGIGRTGTMLAAYFIAHGDSVETAVHRVREVQPGAIESVQQMEFLHELEQLLKG